MMTMITWIPGVNVCKLLLKHVHGALCLHGTLAVDYYCKDKVTARTKSNRQAAACAADHSTSPAPSQLTSIYA